MVVTIVSRCEMARRGHRLLAEELSERLPRYFRDIVQVDWSLDEDGVERIVHCNLHGPTGHYHVTAHAETFSHAMHLAMEKLLKQRGRQKETEVRRRRADTLPPAA